MAYEKLVKELLKQQADWDKIKENHKNIQFQSVEFYKKIGHKLHEHKYLWLKCTKRETIIAAWKKLRKGKTKRRDVRRIEANFEHYLELMVNMIKNTYEGGDPELEYKPQKLRPRYIFEHGKKRKIYCPPIWDQWVHHIVVQVLQPVILKYSYKFSCGSMPKRGGIYGKRELERVIKKKKAFKYYLKVDIRHFFDNVSIDIVIKELNIFIRDERLEYLIRKIFINFKIGLPLGFYISQWLANFVLNSIDWAVKLKCPNCYIRYVDDLVVCSNNKKYLHSLRITIAKELGKLHLRLKKNWQVIKFTYKKGKKKIGRCIDFMGFQFDRYHTILRKHIVVNTNRLATRLYKTKRIAIKQAQSMMSRIGWFKNSDTKNFYKDNIQPKISINCLKDIIRKYQKRGGYGEFKLNMA